MGNDHASALRHFAVGDGIAIAAEIEGADDAVPVLLLHGGGQSRQSWRGMRRLIAAAGYQAVSLDLRGHGDSGWPADADYRLDAFAADIRAVVAQLGRSPVLVGASLGGISAAIAIAEAPGLDARGLALVDVAHRSEKGGAERIMGFMTERPDGFADLEEAADAIALYLPHRPRPQAASLKRSLRRKADGRWHWHWDPRFVDTRRPLGLAMPPDRLIRAFQSIACPTLLVRGGSSEIVSESIAEEFTGYMPAARCVDIPDATHMVAGDDNAAFGGAISSFLDEICGKAPAQ